jgi:hypothetical protein
MFNKNNWFTLAIFLIISTKTHAIGFSMSPDLIKQLKIAYANLDHWINQDAISVQTKSCTIYQYYPQEHKLVPETHVSYEYDFANKSAQKSFDNYRDLTTQLANRQLLNNFSTGCLLGALTAFCQQKLAESVTTPQALTVLLASAAGIATWEYDPKSDLPSYDLQTLEACPSAGTTATIMGNTLVASVFAFSSYLVTQGLLTR